MEPGSAVVEVRLRKSLMWPEQLGSLAGEALPVLRASEGFTFHRTTTGYTVVRGEWELEIPWSNIDCTVRKRAKEEPRPPVKASPRSKRKRG